MSVPDPLVSVVIPNFNHARFLTQRIESVLDQTFQDFELIVLDDHSTDQSRSIIETYRGHPRLSHIVYNETNSGSPFKQWAKGIGLARGSLIWIAESDDYCERTFLETVVRQMSDFPEAGLVYTQSLEIDEISGKQFLSFEGSPRFGTAFRESYFSKGREELNTKLAYENTIPNASAVLFRKSVYLETGGADETMKLCGDWMMWVKMLLKSDVCFIARPLNFFRLTPISVRSRLSGSQTFHERNRILKLMMDNGISAAGKSQRALIHRLVNSYKISELRKPIHTIMEQRKLIKFPEIKIARALFFSVLQRAAGRISGLSRNPAF